MVLAEPMKRIRFTYKNYKGAVEDRTVYAERIYWGSTEYHPEPQWLLDAWDYSRQAKRSFALKDMTDVQPAGE